MSVLNPLIQDYWQTVGFNQPTPIQEKLFETLQELHSCVAIAPTGTGKTLAYLLPLFNHVEANHTLQSIILAPSQELAKQIFTVAQEWGAVFDLTVQLVIGSANIKRQIEALKLKPEIIVATPGRLVELSQQTRKLKFHQVHTVVLDEADYLLQEDQKKSIEALDKKMMKDVHHIYVSATLGEALEKLLRKNQTHLPIYQVVAADNAHVKHIPILTQNRQKVQQLKRLSQVEGMRALVFVEQTHLIETIAAKLVYEGVSVGMLHAQLSKNERQIAISAFEQRKLQFLLTTDVAARGLDISELECVIHYNRVEDLTTYIHRSGRTGRMNREGLVISLVNEQELRDLQLILKDEVLLEPPYRVYHSQLVLESQVKAYQETLKQESRDNESSSKMKKARKAKKSDGSSKKQKKIKNRHRTQKNKGKRKTSSR